MVNHNFFSFSLSLLVILTAYAAHADNPQGDKQVVDVTDLTSLDDIEWVFVGCAAYPAKKGTHSDGTITAQQTESRTDLADRDTSTKPESQTIIDRP